MKKAWELLAAGVAIAATLAAILMLPVWKQNRYGSLMRAQLKLEKRITALQDSCLLLDKDIAKLSNRSRLEEVGLALGLEFSEPAVKIAGVHGAR